MFESVLNSDGIRLAPKGEIIAESVYDGSADIVTKQAVNGRLLPCKVFV